MKVAILGGGNCHALAIARHFSAQGISVLGIGRSPARPPALWPIPWGYRYFVAHIGAQLSRALQILDAEQPDVVINIAAQGESAASFGADSWRFYETNCVLLARLVEAVSTRRYLTRFVQVSTSELYGSVDHAVDERAPVNATSPYAISKAAFDHHLEVLHRVRGFPVQIIRPSNCYTIGQQLHRVIPKATIAAVYGRRFRLEGGGAAHKSYLDSDDLASAILTVLQHGDPGQVFNVGPDVPISIRELVLQIGRVVGAADFFDEAPPRLGEDACYWLDSSKLKRLGWAPTVGLDQGLERVASWVRKHPELARMNHEYSIRP